MNGHLEDYLKAVAERLRPLPVTCRSEELKELRQHLLNAVTVNQEFGQSEDEAVQTALEQFGKPNELGDNLVLAWLRGRRASRRSFWGAAILALALTFWPNLAGRVVQVAEPYILHMRLPHLWEIILAEDLLLLPSYFACGALCAFAFPKRGVAGTALTEACLFLLFMGSNIGGLMREAVADKFLTFLFVAYWGLCPLMAVLGARHVGRWREASGIRLLRRGSKATW